MSVDYEGLIHKAIHQFHAFSADANNSSSKRKESQQASDMDALDFEKETPKDEDRYLAGNFEPDTWVGKLESDEEGEQGSYNVALDPTSRTPYALLMPTKDYHPQSAPLRPAYLIHAHRLLSALEDALNETKDGNANAANKDWRVIAVYDCGEKSGAIIGHKCVRLFASRKLNDPPIPFVRRPILSSPSSTSSESLLQAFTDLLSKTQGPTSEPFIPTRPSYNLIMTREDMLIVKRQDDGFLNAANGRWDGARLVGIGF